MEIDEYSEGERFIFDASFLYESYEHLPPIDRIQAILIEDQKEPFPDFPQCKMERTGDRITLTTPDARVSIHQAATGDVVIKAEYVDRGDGGREMVRLRRKFEAATFEPYKALDYLLPN